MNLPAFDLEQIWRDHKRFILAVGGGFVAFLGLLGFQRGLEEEARRGAARNLALEREIEALSDELLGREGYEGGVERVLLERVGPETKAALELGRRPAAPEDFELRKGDDPQIKLVRARERVEQALAEAERRGLEPPKDPGLARQARDDQVPELLAVLDVAERVLRAAVEARVAKIDALAPLEAELIEASPPPEGDAGAAAAAGGAAGAESGGPRPVLRRAPVRLAFTAPVDALQAFLATFQRSGSFLEVATLAVSRADDGRVKAEIELAGLTLLEGEAAARVAALAAGGSGRPGTGDDGGRRVIRPRGGRAR